MVSTTLKQQLLDLLPKELKGQDILPLELGFGETDPPEDLPAHLTSESEPAVVLWNVPSPGPDGYSAEARSQLRSRLLAWHKDLPTGSHLLIAVPMAASGDGPDASSLPPTRQWTLRHLVQGLSESGFAILRDVPFKSTTSSSDAAPWQLLACRVDPFHIRPYQDGDEAAILELFPTCFHVQRGRDHWQWKYRDNPFGDTAISLAMSEQKELGAHYAGYAMPFYFALDGNPRNFPALQMGDTMTNPVFRGAGQRRSGLLARTVRHFFALRRGGPYGFFYGFNTGPIQRFCRWFIGGSQVEPVGYWRFEGAATPAPWNAHGYRVEAAPYAGSQFDRLFRQAAPHYGFLVRRDSDYLKWRYFDCPDTDYTLLAIRRWRRLVGWGVFRRQDDRILWGDALVHPRHLRAIGPLLSAAVNELGDGDRLPIEAWFSRGPSWWVEHLAALGFERGPHPQGLGFMTLPDGEPEATQRLPELYYCMGDGDLF